MKNTNFKNATALITFGIIIFQFCLILCLYESISVFNTSRIKWILITMLITWLGISIFSLYDQWKIDKWTAIISVAVSGLITFLFTWYTWSFTSLVNLLKKEGIDFSRISYAF